MKDESKRRQLTREKDPEAYIANGYFRFIQRNREKINELFESPLAFCMEILSDGEDGILTDGTHEFLRSVSTDQRHYLISSTYAMLLGAGRRRELSAYFTPPALAKAVIDVSRPFVNSTKNPAVLDPACGGGSFLTPIARHIAEKKIELGDSFGSVYRSSLNEIRGFEIDAGLASLSSSLLEDMFFRDFGYRPRKVPAFVECRDALTSKSRRKYDLVIGNPPFGKVGAKVEKSYLEIAGRAGVGGHTNLYTLFLLRSLDWVKPGGGLVFVLPTSFIAGPYFAGLRQEIVARAEVLGIDLHEQRKNLFLGAIQDVCVLKLRRRHAGTATNISHTYELGIIDAQGTRTPCGEAKAKGDGDVWTLPVAKRTARVNSREIVSLDRAYTLRDYGYRVRVGKVVPNRERDRLHATQQKGSYPLVWASAIRPDGSFDHSASKRLGNPLWYCSPEEGNLQYATRGSAVVVQRTSNRDQERRLNSAAVPKSFRDEHVRGFVGENHVIIIEALNLRPALTPQRLSRLLNSTVVNDRFSAVSGSLSISAKLLERFALPSPALVKAVKTTAYEAGLEKLFLNFQEILVLADLHAVRNPEHAIDESANLSCSSSVDKKASLKRRALA